jgi:hypothetical protein
MVEEKMSLIKRFIIFAKTPKMKTYNSKPKKSPSNLKRFVYMKE